jgi:hypothetical protein
MSVVYLGVEIVGKKQLCHMCGERCRKSDPSVLWGGWGRAVIGQMQPP